MDTHKDFDMERDIQNEMRIREKVWQTNIASLVSHHVELEPGFFGAHEKVTGEFVERMRLIPRTIAATYTKDEPTSVEIAPDAETALRRAMEVNVYRTIQNAKTAAQFNEQLLKHASHWVLHLHQQLVRELIASEDVKEHIEHLAREYGADPELLLRQMVQIVPTIGTSLDYDAGTDLVVIIHNPRSLLDASVRKEEIAMHWDPKKDCVITMDVGVTEQAKKNGFKADILTTLSGQSLHPLLAARSHQMPEVAACMKEEEKSYTRRTLQLARLILNAVKIKRNNLHLPIARLDRHRPPRLRPPVEEETVHANRKMTRKRANRIMKHLH